MNLNRAAEVVSPEINSLIETLNIASLSRNFSVFEDTLLPFLKFDWNSFTETEKAWLNYFSGWYFVNVNKVENKKGNLEKGKNHLTKSLDLFLKYDYLDLAIESKISLGWADFQLGEIENYEIYLLDALNDCRENSEGYFSVYVSLLIIYYKEKRIEEGIETIQNLEKAISTCKNLRIKCQFYNNSGLLFRLAERYTEAIFYYQTALDISGEIDNLQFQGINKLNLAYCYYSFDKQKLALSCITEALEIFQTINDKNNIANTLDSLALIYLKLGNYHLALKAINDALDYFRKGENFFAYSEALWNRIEILVELRIKSEIFATFDELIRLVALNQDLLSKYIAKFEKLVIFPFGKNLEEKIKSCKDQIILPILENSKNKTEAARKLGKKSHHNLSYHLNKKEYSTASRSDQPAIRPISTKKNFVINTSWNIKALAFFLCENEISETYFGINAKSIIVVTQSGKGRDGDMVLLKNQEPFFAEIVEEDGSFCFIDENGMTVSGDFNILGRIIAYGLSANADEPVHFLEIPKNLFNLASEQQLNVSEIKTESKIIIFPTIKEVLNK